MLKTFSYSATTSLELDQTWELLADLANRKTCSDVYADVEWSGTPWKPGSCITGNLKYPVGMPFRYVLQTCQAPHQITYLAHGLDPAFTTHRIVQFDLESAEPGTSIKVTSYVLGEPTTPGRRGNNLKAVTDRWLKGFVKFCNSRQNELAVASEKTPS